jgi:NADH:ubiquinone oxidoreductase subunit H
LVCFLSELGGVWYNKGYNNLLFLNSLNLFTGLEFFTEFLTTMPRNASVWFATKLLICISMLIFVRGGLPRYRYDYLTKIG